MSTPTEKFLALKNQARNGLLEISLSDFGTSFSQIENFFPDLTFDISGINIISETENKLKLKAFSKDFLFKKTLFKNESVDIEVDFELINGELEILAICKLRKTPKSLSKLPVIGDLLKPFGFGINDFAYILSTKDISVINSANFSEYKNIAANLKPGINLSGYVDLSNAADIIKLALEPVKAIIGDGPYFMSWNMKNKLDIDLKLNIPKDINLANIFNIGEPKLVIKAGDSLQVSLDGLFEIPIPLASVNVLGGFSFAPGSFMGKFNLDNVADKVPAPFGYPGIHLTTLTAIAGFENGLGKLGVEGSFYIGPKKPDNISNKTQNETFGMASNEFTFEFDAVPGKISPNYCYLYLDQLTLELYLRALTNQPIDLPAFLDKISMEQLMFHWNEKSPNRVKPDGTIAHPLFGFSGIANVFGHRTFAECNATGQESSGRFIADPINIGGFLKITGDGQPPETYKGNKIKPGGMQFSFHSTGKPYYLEFSTAVEVLGLTGEAKGHVSDDGIEGKFKTNVAGILKDELSLTLNGENFDVQTQIHAGLKMNASLGKLGTIKLDTFLDGGFSARFIDQQYSNTMNLHFKVLGINFDLGEVNVAVTDLKEIVRILEEQIVAAIQKLGENVLAWLKAIAEELITFAGDKLKQIGEALNQHFKKSLDQAAKLLKSAKHGAKQVGEILHKGYNATKEEVANALKNAEYAADDIFKVLKDVYRADAKAAALVMNGLEYSATEIGKGLKAVYDIKDAKLTAQIFRQINVPAKEVVTVLQKVYNLKGKALQAPLKFAKYPSKEVNKALSKVLKGLSGGGCILSSAAVEHKGLPDDSYELETLRKFRDEYMMNMPGGSELVDDYYDMSDKIVEKMTGTPQETAFYERIYNELILPSVRLIEQNKLEETFHYYRNYVLALNKEFFGN